MNKVKVFLSYSHNDELYKKELDDQLIMLKRNKLIETWNDRRMLPGDRFDEIITENLNSSDIIILLISVSFLNSYYCYEKEMKKALQKHKKGQAVVIPVILSPCDWQKAPFGKLLACPKDGKEITSCEDRDKAYLNIVKEIEKRINDLMKNQKVNNNVKQLPPSNRKRGVVISLPINSSIKVDERFLQETKYMCNILSDLHTMIEENIKDAVKELNEMKEICKDHNDIMEYELICTEAFFSSICNYIAVHVFRKFGVRVHIRYLDKDKTYKKFVATYEESTYENELTPIAYNEGLIFHAGKNKCSLLKSQNMNLRKDTMNSERWKDYLTLVFTDYYESGNPIITMGISIETEGTLDNILYYLNYCEFEKILQRYFNRFSKLSGINIKNVIKYKRSI